MRQTLLLHDNVLVTLRGARRLLPPTLELLRVEQNELASLVDLAELAHLSRLRQLDLRDNPCLERFAGTSRAPTPAVRRRDASGAPVAGGRVDHRRAALYFVPSLHIIDGHVVSERDRCAGRVAAAPPCADRR